MNAKAPYVVETIIWTHRPQVDIHQQGQVIFVVNPVLLEEAHHVVALTPENDGHMAMAIRLIDSPC